MTKFANASILSAFEAKTIGSKVIDSEGFLSALSEALESHDQSSDRTPGQHFVHMPESSLTTVSAGVGKRTANPEDFHCREHRGQVGCFLKREHAAEVEGLAVVVYTAEAYKGDPEVDDAEAERIGDASHVLVAVLAFAGPQAPLTPYRLVSNLAGGNKDVESWSREEILEKAAQSKKYYDEWCVVAD